MGCHALRHGIFLTQGSKHCLLSLLHWQAGSLSLSTTWEALSLFIQLTQQTLMEVLLGGQYHVVGTEAANLGSNILAVT